MTADNISNYLCNIGAHNTDNDSVIETLKEMQSKGLITKLYRPIETNNTTSKTPQSTTYQSKTPPAEENHFITINDSINKSIPQSLNRSLPANQIVELNTTLYVLSIGNSSLNARLEALETELYRKIMAMKSYFMDELRSLKQEAPVTKERDHNQDKTTPLKNRIKLLELENRLLKCDVFNEQRFIHTILEHNPKVSHNTDVTAASSNTYDHHVTNEPQYIRENQNGETSNTEHYDLRKHDYKPNRENKKAMITTKKKRNRNKITYQQLVVTVMKTTYKKSPPIIITYRSYKYFNNDSFREALLRIECNGNNCDENFKDFTSTCNIILNEQARQKKKV